MKIEKISFAELGTDEIEKMLSLLSGAERENVVEIIDGFSEEDFEIPAAFSLTDGAIVIRAFFEGEFYFIYPIEIRDDADICLAIDRTVRYAMLEGVVPVFECVPYCIRCKRFCARVRSKTLKSRYFKPSSFV